MSNKDLLQHLSPLIDASETHKPEREASHAQDLVVWLSDFSEVFVGHLRRKPLKDQLSLMVAFSAVFTQINEVYQVLSSDRQNVGDREIEKMQELVEVVSRLESVSELKFRVPNLTELPNIDSVEVHALVATYLHDVGNTVFAFASLADSIIQGEEFGMTYEIFQQPIQEGLTNFINLQRAFDLKEFKVRNEPIDLIALLNYIQKKARYYDQENSNGSGAVKIEFSAELDEQPQWKNLEVGLNIPAFVRVLTNLVQNAEKAYRVDAARNAYTREPVLRIHITVKGSNLIIGAEDDGPGFPEYARNIPGKLKQLFGGEPSNFTSVIDQAVIKEYQPKLGRTSWTQGIQGNGLGLAGLVMNLKEVGIEMRMGSRLDSAEQILGARTEIIVPLKPKSNQQ